MELPYPEEEHRVRVMCGDQVAIAYEWLKGYTENLNSMIDKEDGEPITVEELISTAMSHLDEDSGWGDYIIRGGAFEGHDIDPTFWDKLAIFKQIEIPTDKRNGFLSCSC